QSAALTAPPYRIVLLADALSLGRYSVCGRAVDRLGNRSDWTCVSARVYPPATLKRDDGVWDNALDLQPLQIAGVFQNPYDVPVTIARVEIFSHAQSAINALHRAVIWAVENHRPTTEIDGTALLGYRTLGSRFTVFRGWHAVIPAHGLFAAGFQ